MSPTASVGCTGKNGLEAKKVHHLAKLGRAERVRTGLRSLATVRHALVYTEHPVVTQSTKKVLGMTSSTWRFAG